METTGTQPSRLQIALQRRRQPDTGNAFDVPSERVQAALECYDALVKLADIYVRRHNRDARKTDSPVFVVLNDSHDPALCALSDSHDLVHDVYINVFRRLDSLDNTDNLLGYMRRALRLHWLNVCDRRINNRPYSEDVETMGDNPKRATGDAFVDAALREALATLSARDRRIVEHKIAGYSAPATAERVGVHQATVDRIMKSARLQLVDLEDVLRAPRIA